MSIAGTVISSCDTHDKITDDDNQSHDNNYFSNSDTNIFGNKLDSLVQNSPDLYNTIQISEVQQYLQSVVNQILAESPKAIFQYSVSILKDENSANVFTLPSGKIYISTGLLKLLDNEADLAAVFANEIALTENKYAVKTISKSLDSKTEEDIVKGKNRKKLSDIFNNMLKSGGLLCYSTDNLINADNYAFCLLKSTPWYPGEILSICQKILSYNTKTLIVKVYISTHPINPSRINSLNTLISQSTISKPNESNLFAERYKTVINTLP